MKMRIFAIITSIIKPTNDVIIIRNDIICTFIIISITSVSELTDINTKNND